MSAKWRVTCGAGQEIAKLDPDDVIGDATAENPNGSCETVLRGDSAPDEGTGPGRNCPAPAGGSTESPSAAPQAGEEGARPGRR